MVLPPDVSVDQSLQQTPERLVEESVPPPANPGLAPLLAPAEAPGEQPQAAPGAPSVMLRGVVFAGNTVIPAETLAALATPMIGKPATLEDLRALSVRVRTLYREKGYVFTRVVASGEEVRDGVATLRVVEARVGSVTVEESAEPVGPALLLLTRIGKVLEGKENPRLADLERVLLLMNDVPGITRATAVPRAGKGAPGTLDIVVNVERKPVSGVIFADTYQSPALGEGLIGVVAEYGSWSSAGDSTRLTLANSFWDRIEDLDERHLVQVDHSRLLTDTGLTLEGRLLYSLSKPDVFGIDVENQRIAARIGLRYPVIRTRPLSLWAHVAFEASEATNRGGIESVDSLRVIEAGAEVLQRDSSGYTSATAEVRAGLDVLGASTLDDGPLTRTDADGGFVSFHAEIRREQVIFGDFSLSLRAAGQYSPEPLLSGEEFAIGGTSFARGYDPSEFSGDIGYGVSIELHYKHEFSVQDQSVTADIYGFADHGQTWNLKGGSPDSPDISSVGLGLSLTLPYDTTLAAEVAKPLSALRRTQDDGIRAFLKIQKRF